MKMQFLGTGAADFNWAHYGEDGVFGSTVTLINDKILIDCGPTAVRAIERFGVDISRITAVVNTHSHGDHFNIDQLRQIAGDRKIAFYASPQACELVSDFCEVHPLTFGDEFTIGDCSFLTLPSNHAVTDLHEETFNYLIKSDKTLLYALDTAWMLAQAWELIGDTHIDAVVWDATMSEAGNWRIFHHSDPEMFSVIRGTMERWGNFDGNLKVWFDHRAKTLWPENISEQEAIAAKYNAMIAHEGETVII